MGENMKNKIETAEGKQAEEKEEKKEIKKEEKKAKIM